MPWSVFSGFAIAPASAIVVLLLAGSILLAAVCLPVMFCCYRGRGKSQGSPYTKRRRDVLTKKNLFAIMLAHLDEFDQLTPLVVTPNPSIASAPSPRLLSESDSPPPPRRPHQGKTLLVPLAGRYRSPAVPLLGTPDSRVTSIEGGTTKSCATIPEDDEDVDDLLSIDRTSASLIEARPSRWPVSISAYNVTFPQHPPAFTRSSRSDPLPVPVPSYSAPEVPKTPPASSIASTDTGSPVETTGSVSDSFYINSDVISSTNGSQIFDTLGCGESDFQAKYVLHRIEEESIDENLPQIRLDDGMPRSISQQFELLLRRC